MGIGLGTLGYSLNTKSLTELDAASKKLDNLTPNIKAIVGDEMKGYMINGDAAIGVTFSGEASEMLDSNEHLHYVVPSEGSNLWFDNLVIPKTANTLRKLTLSLTLCLSLKMLRRTLNTSAMQHQIMRLRSCYLTTLKTIRHFIHQQKLLKI